MYGEPPDCFTETAYKARKQHNCCECRAPIQKGEIYVRMTGIWVGEASTFKTCWPCSEVKQQIIHDYNMFEGLCFGHLQEALQEIEEYGEPQ